MSPEFLIRIDSKLAIDETESQRLCIAVLKLCTFGLKLAINHHFFRSKIRHFGDFILGNEGQNPPYKQVIDNYCGFDDCTPDEHNSMVERSHKKGGSVARHFATRRDRDP